MEYAITGGTLVTIFFFFGLILSVLDIKNQKIPRFLSLSFLFLLLIIQTFYAIITAFQTDSFSFTNLLWALYKPFVGAGFGLLLFTIVRFFSGKKLGLADVWFSGSVGAFLGIYGWFFSILFSCLFSLIWIFGLNILRSIRAKEAGINRSNKKDFFAVARQIKLAFIPFLLGGTLPVCIFYFVPGIRL